MGGFELDEGEPSPFMMITTAGSFFTSLSVPISRALRVYVDKYLRFVT